jgi:hypothetical protein
MFKSIIAMGLGFCVSVLVTDLAKPASTYDLPGPADAFMMGNHVHSWCQRARPMALAYTAGLWDLSSRTVLLVHGFRGLARESAVEFQLDRLGRFCEPEHVVLDQNQEPPAKLVV